MAIAEAILALIGLVAICLAVGAGIGELMWRRTARRIKRKYPHCGW
jgi:hypothetical protein